MRSQRGCPSTTGHRLDLKMPSAITFRTHNGGCEPQSRPQDPRRTLLEMRIEDKLTLMRTELRALETEAIILRVLQPIGLPVPTIVRQARRDRVTSTMTKLVLSCQLGVTLFETGWSKTDERCVRAKLQVRQGIARIAAQKSYSFGLPGQVAAGWGCSTWAHAFAVMIEEYLQDGEDEYLNLPYNEIRQFISNNEEALADVNEARLVAPDTCSKSVLVDPSRGDVVAFFNFKEAFWGDPDLHEPVGTVRGTKGDL